MRPALAYTGVALMLAALALYAYRTHVLDGRPETFAVQNTVGMEIDRGTDPALTAALQKLADSSQWLACVPVIQLEKMALAQTGTGVRTLKALDVLGVLNTQKFAAMAYIKRLPYSPEFKAGLNKYVDYAMSAIASIIKQFTNPDGFVDMTSVATAMTELRRGYCTLGTNFGSGNSFLPATA